MRNKAEKTTLPNWITKRFCVGLPPALLGGQISVTSSQVSRIPRPRPLFMFTRVAADASGAFAPFARTAPPPPAVAPWEWFLLLGEGYLYLHVVGQQKTTQCIHMSQGHRPLWSCSGPH